MATGKLRKKQSEGLGDTIAKVTKATGIDKAIQSITDDCGCEERRQKLNKLFGYKLKVINCPDENDKDFIMSIGKSLNNEQRKRICELYSHTFNLPYYEPCVGCNPKPYVSMIERLKNTL